MRESKYLKRVKKTLQIKPFVLPAEEKQKKLRERTPNEQWKLLAKVLDRIFFIIYVFVVCIFMAFYFPRPDINNLDVLIRDHIDE